MGASRVAQQDPSRVVGVVLAAGRGARFGGAKQFEWLAGETLVDRAVTLLRPVCRTLVLALPQGVGWPGAQDRTVAGGATRLETLRNALAALPDGDPGCRDVVLIHDCARPLATAATVLRLIEAVQRGADAAVPAWESPDVIKRRHPDGSLRHVGREGYVIVQSPYACALPSLRRALGTAADVVEETEAIEHAGGRVVAVPGDPWSHHVVTARDLANAALLLTRPEETE